MTLNEIAAIASRYLTRMADAMIDACVRRADETGERIAVPKERLERLAAIRRGSLPEDDPTDEEWRRMVEGNSDTRWSHV